MFTQTATNATPRPSKKDDEKARFEASTPAWMHELAAEYATRNDPELMSRFYRAGLLVITNGVTLDHTPILQTLKKLAHVRSESKNVSHWHVAENTETHELFCDCPDANREGTRAPITKASEHTCKHMMAARLQICANRHAAH